MFSVIFEVNPAEGKKDEYLDNAKHLKPILETVDGFVDNERFESQIEKGWILSHSTWRDEKSVVRWRTESEHHKVQEKGRFDIFRDYHLRVGQVTADSRPPQGYNVYEQRFDETAAAAKLIELSEAAPEGLPPEPDAGTIAARLGGLGTAHPGLVDWDVFESIVQPGKFIRLTSWRDAAAAEGSPQGGLDIRRRRVRVIRDYGMFDRAEAPQYYPPVPSVVYLASSTPSSTFMRAPRGSAAYRHAGRDQPGACR